jgi:DNA-binding transcriptional LysR family regulator
MTSIELRQFRYFAAVAEERHFGRAAERLEIAQPGLSHQIKGLERSLGVPLFVRDKRGVELTEAGLTLLEHARLVLELADRAVESTRLAVHGKKGILKVGTPAGGIHPLGNDLLRLFQEHTPEAQVDVHPGYVPQSLDAMTRHELDVAIVLVPFDRPDSMRYLKLGDVELQLAVPEEHRLATLERVPRTELLREPFLDWPRSMNPPLIDALHRSLFGDATHPDAVELADVMEVSRLLAVAEGRGIAVALFPSVAELQIPRVVFRPMDPPPHLEYGIAWLDNNASTFMASFVDLARDLTQPARIG